MDGLKADRPGGGRVFRKRIGGIDAAPAMRDELACPPALPRRPLGREGGLLLTGTRFRFRRQGITSARLLRGVRNSAPCGGVRDCLHAEASARRLARAAESKPLLDNDSPIPICSALHLRSSRTLGRVALVAAPVEKRAKGARENRDGRYCVCLEEDVEYARRRRDRVWELG